MKTQSETILEHLENYGNITPLEALQHYGCMRLGARILELKRAGFPIKSRLVCANGKHFAKYSLDKTVGV